MSSEERERLAGELKRALEFMREPLPNRQMSHRAPALDESKKSLEATTTAAAPPSLAGPSSASDSILAPRLRSISFTPALLECVLAHKKVVTRRPVRPTPIEVAGNVALAESGEPISPLYLAGDRLWVREKWARLVDGGRSTFIFERDAQHRARWNSSRFMPRIAARTFLCVSEVTISRLRSITAEQAIAEGIGDAGDPVVAFLNLWDSIYGDSEFASRNDPWVWVVAFAVDASGAPA